MRRICVFTGTRAEYGLLLWVMRALNERADVELKILASGAHLSPEFGLTVRAIEADGFTVDARVEMLLSADTRTAIASSTGLGLVKYADSLAMLKPDLAVVLGDRFEAFAFAAAAVLLDIPIAHIHGGEITEGAVDDALRHAITKMSLLHFTSAEPYRRRIIQMGEAPDRVFNVGAPGIDNLHNLDLMPREELALYLGIDPQRPILLATYHPETVGVQDPAAAVEGLLSALEQVPQASIILTHANADMGGRAINRAIDRYADERPGRVVASASLGQRVYLSAMQEAAVVVGNSSSGIIEAPAAGVPTVNIGRRQQGRLRAPSIIDCGEDAEAIATAIDRALSDEFRSIAARRVSPYGAGGASAAIAESVAAYPLGKEKSFHDLDTRRP